MPIIDKFGGAHRPNSTTTGEDVTGTVERILRRKNYLSAKEGVIDAGNRRIVHVDTPIKDDDVVNKAYVENEIESALEWFPPERDLDLKRKRITNLALPIQEDDAVPKKYVDQIHQGYSTMVFPLRIDPENPEYQSED